MNIFIILIMGLMLASYQYFVSKRTNNNTKLDKQELLLNANLTCIKQFHEKAFTNDRTSLTNSTAYEYEEDLKSIITKNQSFSCQGDENISIRKYCINAAGDKIECKQDDQISPDVTEHCLSTTTWKNLNKKDMYLTSQILQKGLFILKDNENKVDGKHVIMPENKPTPTNDKEQIIGIGLLSCMKQQELSNLDTVYKCEKGQYALKQADNTFKCVNATNIKSCTSHEYQKEFTVTEAGGKANCTKISEYKYCCANTNTSTFLTCKPSEKVIWNPKTRYYTCSDGTEFCQNKNGIMIFRDDKDQTIPSKPDIFISDAWLTKYKSNTNKFYCIHNKTKYIEKCKAESKNQHDYGYIDVKDLDKETDGETVKDGKTTMNKPVCQLAYRKNSNAIENCSVCETTEFINQKWQCKPYQTFAKLKAALNQNSKFIDELMGDKDNKKNDKKIEGCFANCSTEQIDKIKSGIYNEATWGLSYNATTRIWNCFECDSNSYNNACTITSQQQKHSCGVDITKITVGNCNQTKMGKCFPKACSTEYQVLIDGQCYTKWCNNNLPPLASINQARERCCPSNTSWMLFNKKLTCVYCVRPPATRIE